MSRFVSHRWQTVGTFLYSVGSRQRPGQVLSWPAAPPRTSLEMQSHDLAQITESESPGWAIKNLSFNHTLRPTLLQLSVVEGKCFVVYFLKFALAQSLVKHVVQRDESSSPPWGCRLRFHGSERLKYLLSTCSPFLLEIGNHGCMGWRHWSADPTGSSTHLSHTSSVPWPSSVPKGHCCLALTDLCHGLGRSLREDRSREMRVHQKPALPRWLLRQWLSSLSNDPF